MHKRERGKEREREREKERKGEKEREREEGGRKGETEARRNYVQQDGTKRQGEFIIN